MTAGKVILASILAIATSITVAKQQEPVTAPLPRDSVYQLSAKLTDSAGHPLAWQDLRGRPRVATMFYTSCRYVCPLIVDSLRAVERGLSESQRRRIGFVLISMDPERDTPQALAKVKSERRLDSSRWLLLRPEPADLRSLTGVLGVRYRALADGEFNHTTMLVLLDADGRVLARNDRIGGDGDAEFLAAVRAALDGN
jgi:protein SCO1/2